MRGSIYSNGVSGAGTQHRKAGDAASPGQTARPTGGTVILEGKESLQEEGVALPHWLTFSRLQSSQAGKNLPEEAYLPVVSSQAPWITMYDSVDLPDLISNGGITLRVSGMAQQ